MSFTANAAHIGNVSQFQPATLLSADEIENLLVKLARGHLSTMQEEYADLKRVLCCFEDISGIAGMGNTR